MSSYEPASIHSHLPRSSSLATAVLCSCMVLAVLYVWWLAPLELLAQPWTIVALVSIKAAIEVMASVYAITFLCAAVVYRCSGQDEAPHSAPWPELPRAAAMYLRDRRPAPPA